MSRTTIKELKPHWRILTAATLGWTLDAFDMTIFFFLIPHLVEAFNTDLKAITTVVIVMGVGKIIGALAFGAAADKFGRKLPFMIAIIWFCAFSGLSGLAWSYASFVVIRFFFGIGFGGEWSTSTSLMMESVPPKLRPVASGLMMAGYEVGYLLSAFCYFVIYPELGWRWMFFIGVLPALLAIFVRRSIPESPEWSTAVQKKDKSKRKLTITPAAVQACLFMAGANVMFYSIFALYPTFLTQVRGFSPSEVFPFIATYSVASIIGKPLAGIFARQFGERKVLVTYMLLTVPCTLLYTYMESRLAMFGGAVLMGLISNSIYGIVPTYLARRFPAEERGLGLGVANAFNSTGNVAPYVIAIFTATYGLSTSMTGAIIASAMFTLLVVSVRTEKWFAVPEVIGKASHSDADNSGLVAKAS